MSYKRPFSAMERDSLTCSSEHNDSIWIPQKYRRRMARSDSRYDTPVVRHELTTLLSNKYPVFKTENFGEDLRRKTVDYVLVNNKAHCISPFALPERLDQRLSGNTGADDDGLKHILGVHTPSKIDETYTKASPQSTFSERFIMLKDGPTWVDEAKDEPVPAAGRASVLPTWIWTVWKLVLFALFVVSVVYGFLIVYQDVPDVWHSQVPQLLFGQRQWKPYYVDLWMGMSAYYWGDYDTALRRFRTYNYAILADYDNSHEYENEFTSSLWMCKSYIKTDGVFLADFYCENPVQYMSSTKSKNVPVSVKYDCLYTCAIGLVHYAEKMKSIKKMIIAHDWLNQTKTLLGYYTREVQYMLKISDPHIFQLKLNKLEEEKVRKAAEEEKKRQERKEWYKRFEEEQARKAADEEKKRQKLKEEYERLDEEYRKQQEEERILEEKRKEYWYQQWKKQEERFANSQRVPSDSTKKTHWQVLGLEPGATAAQIKKAYRQKSLETHPDKVCGAGKCKSEQEQREANEKFHQVVRAFEALSLLCNAY